MGLVSVPGFELVQDEGNVVTTRQTRARAEGLLRSPKAAASVDKLPEEADEFDKQIER
jgi:hypothetical protein